MVAGRKKGDVTMNISDYIPKGQCDFKKKAREGDRIVRQRHKGRNCNGQKKHGNT